MSEDAKNSTDPLADDEMDPWFAAKQAHGRAEVSRLRAQAAESGLLFQAYLVPSTAMWIFDMIEQDMFDSPEDAVFQLFKEAEELWPHKDLRQELFRRKINAAMDDPRPGTPSEQVFARLKERYSKPLPLPAQWTKMPKMDEETPAESATKSAE